MSLGCLASLKIWSLFLNSHILLALSVTNILKPLAGIILMHKVSKTSAEYNKFLLFLFLLYGTCGDITSTFLFHTDIYPKTDLGVSCLPPHW